jgi:uncharacterized protein (TIGR00251 family)
MKVERGRVIAVESHSEGSVLPVRAHPGARRNEVGGEHDGSLRVAVTQAPEKGKANKAVAGLLAEKLGVRKSQIELLSGETSSQKRFLIRGLTPKEVLSRLAGEFDLAQMPTGKNKREKKIEGKEDEGG